VEQSTHYLIKSAFFLLKLRTAAASDAGNAKRHVKWMWMCVKLQIIRNAYDAEPV